MLDTHTAIAQEADRYAAERMAAIAAAKAKRLWPDVIGDVLADEIMAQLDLPSWMHSQTRTQRLIDAILSITEGSGDPAHAQAHSARYRIAATEAATATDSAVAAPRVQPSGAISGWPRSACQSSSPTSPR